MDDMVSLTGRYLQESIDAAPSVAVWVGGSMGRREMLPNSDLDVFFIHSSPTTIPSRWNIHGFDRVESGQLTLSTLSRLTSRSLIDANQYIDGRALVPSHPATEAANILAAGNTYDRQFANLITEHFYYRYFDFHDKRTRHGANIKYSSGSSRSTLFYNFYNRMITGELPAQRKAGPEFLDGVAASEKVLGVNGPYRALDLIQVVKNAAISNFDATSDIRHKYVSRTSLDQIHATCEQRLDALGVRDANDFVLAYASARREVEAGVDAVVEHSVAQHRAADAISAIATASRAHLHEVYRLAVAAHPEDALSLLSYGAWSLATRIDTTANDMARLARFLMLRPVHEVAGAMTAIACSPVSSAHVLRWLIDWAERADAGSYLLKLISRNSHTSNRIRQLALAAYTKAEIVRVQ
jgi:hypothetical protein